MIQNVNSNDDIVVMTDVKSLIYGKPFEYVFARQNRRPSLYYLRHDVIRFPPDYVIQQSDILQGQTLKAEDPDEDDHYITISPLESDVSIPALLNKPEIKFKVEVSDGQLTDHQIITIIREQ